MAAIWARHFYAGNIWRKCRGTYIDRRMAIDGGLCEVCHDRLGVIVHHKVRLTQSNIEDPAISLNHDLLKLECTECHNKELGDRNLVAFDDDGQPIPIDATPPYAI